MGHRTSKATFFAAFASRGDAFRRLVSGPFVAVLILIAISAGLAGRSLAQENEPSKARLIDFHSHLLNAHSVPLEGIILSRMNLKGVPACVEKWVARLLATILNESTCWPSGMSAPCDSLRGSGPDVKNVKAMIEGLSTRFEQAGQDKRLRKVQPALKRFLRDELGDEAESTVSPELRLALTLGLVFGEDRETLQKAAAGAAAMTRGATVSEPALASLLGLLHFVEVMISCIPEQLECLGDELGAEAHVQHMMDMDHVYTAKGLRPAKKRLEERAWELKELRKSNPTLFTFAPFDPFRHVMDPSFEWLDKQIDDGAVGVKFYPASGYRPSETVIPPVPRGKWRKRQHALRYDGLGSKVAVDAWRSRFIAELDLTPAQVDELVGRPADMLDQINRVFFKWAANRGIPVLSHHTPVGVEALPRYDGHPGYGKQFANPCYWGKVLDAEPKLKLVLGHAGGHHQGSGWFSATDHGWRESFAFKAFALCVLYENAYCDFGYFSEVLDPTLASHFKKRINSLIESTNDADGNDLPGGSVCNLTEVTSPRYPLAGKILYGTDWSMVVKSKGYRYVAASFRKALCPRRGPCPVGDAFFSENAKRLLNLN